MSEGKRRIAAIMFTDIVGYSSLTQRDENLSQELLREHNKLIREIFPKYDGKEIKTIGDAFHLEFPSSLQAVQCGIEIQQAIRARNESEEDERKIELRIGIHVGDVMPEEGDVFGDTVNIASRVQSIASPGGVYLSEDVYLQVRNKIDTPIFRLGTGELKNIHFPVEIYRAILPWEKESLSASERFKFAWQQKRTRSMSLGIGVAIVAVLALTLWLTLGNEPIVYGNNRIAVLPFENISPNPQEVAFMVDGMHDQMIATLSKIEEFEVIAKTSVDYFRNSSKRINEIAGMLNADLILESSMRYAGDRIRITLQLIDGSTEKHLWVEEYDREYSVNDVFDIQSEIAQKVAKSLRVVLLPETIEQLSTPPTENDEAYQLYLIALSLNLAATSQEDFDRRIQLLDEAIQLDPNFAEAYAAKANVLENMAFFGLKDRFAANVESEELVRKALELKPNSSDAHAVLARLAGQRYEWEASTEYGLRAIELNPSDAGAYLAIANNYLFMGELEASLPNYEKSVELNPVSLVFRFGLALNLLYLNRIDEAERQLQLTLGADPRAPFNYYHFAEISYLQERYEDAIEDFQKEYELGNALSKGLAQYGLVLTYVAMGQEDKATQVLDNMLERSKSEYVPPSQLALANFHLGNMDSGFEWVNQAYEQKDFLLNYIKVYHGWNIVRSDERFKELLEKMNLAD